MISIDDKFIFDAVYNLCVQANTLYPNCLYNKLLDKYKKTKIKEEKQKLSNIIKNIELSYKKNRPMCQDTGQVIIFFKIGQNIKIETDINIIANKAVEKAYNDNYFRKSVVKNAIFNRQNTATNTPSIIYTELNASDEIEINVLIKGAGSENYSTVKMFNPTCSQEDIFTFVEQSLNDAGEKACPPYVLGLGIGGTMDKAAVLSKKAFFTNDNTKEEIEFVNNLKSNIKNSKNLLDIKIKTSATHIACLPVALTINCHSCRHASCIIKNNKIIYNAVPNTGSITNNICEEKEEIFTNDTEKIKRLKAGENILLSGEIYTARDSAHQKLFEQFKNNDNLSFDIKNKIIFYAGPCPAKPDEPIGPIGPTTSARMDKFCEFVHKQGMLASIGKGERSEKAKEIIKKYNGKYFTAQGGIACLLAECIKDSEVIAFDELGTEAIRKLYIEKLPVKVEY